MEISPPTVMLLLNVLRSTAPFPFVEILRSYFIETGVDTGVGSGVGSSVGSGVGLRVGSGSGVGFCVRDGGGISVPPPFEVTVPAAAQRERDDRFICKAGRTAVSLVALTL